jgi:hypothetical protein
MDTEKSPEQNVFVNLKDGRKYYAAAIQKYAQKGFMVTEHEVVSPFAVFVQETEFVQLYIPLEIWNEKLERKKIRDAAKLRSQERAKLKPPKKPKIERFKERSYKENCAEYICIGNENVQKYGCYKPSVPRTREWEKHEWDSGRYARRAK